MVEKVKFPFTEIDPTLGALSTPFASVDMALAWTQDRNAPLILGHMNFFLEFDVCFYRSELMFEVGLKRK